MPSRHSLVTIVFRAGLPLLAALFPICSTLSAGAAAHQASKPARTTLVFDQAVPLSSLDPVNPLGYPSGYEALFLVGDGLVQFNSKMHPVPALATKWKVLSDKKTWIFTLRRGVKFQDGTLFTASSVKADFDRMLDPTADPTQQAIWSNFAAVKVLNTYTVQITTKTRFAATLDYLCHGSAVILRIPSNPSQIATHPIGTGPYTLTSMQPGTQAIFTANPHYWGGKPRLKEIILRAVPNPETRNADLRSGGAQIIDAVPAVDLPSLKGAAGVRVEEVKSWVTTYLEFNTASGPLANRLVRQAISHLIDTRGIIKAIFRGDADPIDSPLAPTMPGYLKTKGTSYSTSTALALLRQAGYTESGGKLVKDGQQLHLTFTTPTGQYPNDTEVAQAIQQELQGIGIDVSLQTQTPSNWLSFMRQATPTSGYGDMYLWAFNPSNGDPGYTLAINFGKPGTAAALWNKSFYDSAEVQKLIGQLGQAVNRSKWRSFAARIQQLLIAGVPCAWLYVPRNNVAMSSSLAGVTVLPVQFIILRDASFK